MHSPLSALYYGLLHDDSIFRLDLVDVDEVWWQRGNRTVERLMLRETKRQTDAYNVLGRVVGACGQIRYDAVRCSESEIQPRRHPIMMFIKHQDLILFSLHNLQSTIISFQFLQFLQSD